MEEIDSIFLPTGVRVEAWRFAAEKGAEETYWGGKVVHSHCPRGDEYNYDISFDRTPLSSQGLTRGPTFKFHSHD